jgi:hypothetical protein
MNAPLTTDLDLATRLHNYGTGEWVRRNDRDEMLRVAGACIESLDEIQRLESERAEWSGIAAQRNRNIALLAEQRDEFRDEVERLRLRLSEIHDLANPRLVLATNGAAIVKLTGEFARGIPVPDETLDRSKPEIHGGS